jgi:hypothetical protein
MSLRSKQSWLDAAELVDAYRVFPRVFVLAYLYGLNVILRWAIALPDISIQQSGFISLVAATFPFVLNFYMQTGRDWQKENTHATPRTSNETTPNP